MLRFFRPALTLLLAMTLLLGVVYPAIVTAIGQLAFPEQANGSPIRRDGQVVGSALIGQAFTAPDYFHPRPSATTRSLPDGTSEDAPYNAQASGGSNLGPTSAALAERIARDVAALGTARPIPGDLVTASGSGLDPHISPEAARFQIERVAAARHRSVTDVTQLVEAHIEPRALGFLGEPVVNVLRLNLALDALAPRQPATPPQ